MFADLASSAFRTVLFDSVVLLASTGYFFAEFADVLPLCGMFLAESASSTIFAGIVVAIRVVRTLLFATGLAVVLYIAMLALYLGGAFRALCLDTDRLTVIFTEEMRGAFVTVCLEDDLSVRGTEEVGRAVETGVLLLLMRTLEAFSARHAGLVGSVEGSVGLFDLAARAGAHYDELEWVGRGGYELRLEKDRRNQFLYETI